MSLDTTRGQHVGNYEVLTKIAEGGMGAVYKGRSLITGETVAIKIVPPETAKNPLLLKRFEQEFKAAYLIDHPNVVKAIDFCGTGPSPFLVMEFVDGGSLGQRVEREGRLPEADAVRLIGQVCEGLHRAHKQGLIHRDVKPDNILVTADGVAKLTDLGLVKDIEGELNLTRTGRGLGTPHFMAPEQFRNAKAADVRCDVYSLGATLYMMVTGDIPFAKTSPLDCWMKKVKNDFPEPRSRNPNLSDRTNWAICRAMSAEPGQRPASCREFMEDLTGASWKTGTPTGKLPVVVPRPAGEESASGPGVADRWYMAYRDPAGQLHTVKGTTESVRRNAAAGSLGDPATILVSRKKAGPFVPLKNTPEFRDLVVTPPSGTHLMKPLPADAGAGSRPIGPETRTPLGNQASGRMRQPASGAQRSGRMRQPASPPTTEEVPSLAMHGRLRRSSGGLPAWLPWAALVAVALAVGVALAVLL